MANEKDKKRLDLNKSQIKGLKALKPRRLNLFTSQLYSKTFRKLFGTFEEHKPVFVASE